MAEHKQSVVPWRRDLKLKIAWALLAKLLGLTLLWFLFFRGTDS